jgi:hypothetical protein
MAEGSLEEELKKGKRKILRGKGINERHTKGV